MSAQTLKEFMIEISVKAAKAVNELLGVDEAAGKAEAGLNDMGEAAERAGRKVGTAMRNAAIKVAKFANIAATAAAPIVLEFGRASMQISRDAEEAASKFAAVYGAAADEAGRKIDELAAKIGRSPTKLRAAAADTQGQLRGIGFAAQDAAAMAQEVTAAALDLASFSNKSDAEATRSIQAALLGNADSLKEQFGIIAMETQVAQKLAERGIKASAATEMQKVQARLQIIRDQMKSQGSTGDAVRTKDSTANRAKAADDKVYESQVKAGDKLKELDKKLIEIKAKAADVFLGMSDDAQTAMVSIGLLAGVLSPLATVYQLLAIRKATNALATTADTIATGANTGTTAANTGSLWANIVARMRSIAAWAGGMVWIAATSAQMAASTLATWLNTAATWANNTAQKAWAASVAFVTGPLAAATAAVWSFTVALLSNPITWIILGIVALAAAVYLIYQNWGPISDWFAGIWRGISDAVGQAWDWITQKFWAGIAWLRGLPGQLLSIGQNLMQGIVNGIANGARWVYDKILEVSNAVKNKFKEFFGIHSPSRVFFGFGGHMTDGLVNGLRAGLPAIQSMMDKVNASADIRALATNGFSYAPLPTPATAPTSASVLRSGQTITNYVGPTTVQVQAGSSPQASGRAAAAGFMSARGALLGAAG